MPIDFDPAWEYYQPEEDPDADSFRAVAEAEFASLHAESSVLHRLAPSYVVGECIQCKRPIRGTGDIQRPYKFCSRRCLYDNRYANSAKAAAVTRPCQTCGAEITNRKLLATGAKFCTHACYTASRKATPVIRECKACGNPFTVARASLKNVTCSKACGYACRGRNSGGVL